MKKILFAIGLLLTVIVGRAQSFSNSAIWGLGQARGRYDSVLYFPTGCGVPTDTGYLRSFGFVNNGQRYRMWAIYGDSCGGNVWLWNPKLQHWQGMGGGAIDTTSLSDRINGKVDNLGGMNFWGSGVTSARPSPTAGPGMFYNTDSAWFQYTDGSTWTNVPKSGGGGGSSIDTTSLSNRINLKKDIADSNINIHSYKSVGAATKSDDSIHANLINSIDSLHTIVNNTKVANLSGSTGINRGAYLSRPSASSVPNTYYWSTDSVFYSYSDGLAWKDLKPGTSGGGAFTPIAPFILSGGNGYIDSSKLFSFGWINPSFFGVKGDGKVLNDGNTTASSTTFTSATANFTSIDIGKSIRIQGAGTLNVDFYTTIASITNSTTVALTAAPPSSKTNTTFDYGTDNTTPIQNLFNYIAAIGGGKSMFKRGLYLVFGALQTSVNGVNPNCQIYVPLTNISDSAMRNIDIEGEYQPMQLTRLATGVDANNLQNCTVIKSEITGSGVWPSIISAPWYNPVGFSSNYNFTSLAIKNILFQTKNMVNNSIVATTMGGLNFYHQSQLPQLENIVVFTESGIYSSVLPVNKTYGIIMPQFLNNAIVRANNLTVWGGYNTGLLVTEHASLGLCTFVNDSVAIEFYNQNDNSTSIAEAHAIYVSHVQAEDCITPIVSHGKGTASIGTFSGERDTVSGDVYKGGLYEIYFKEDSSRVWVNQYDNGKSGSGLIAYDVKTNDPSRLRIAHNYYYEVERSQLTIPYSSSFNAEMFQAKNIKMMLTGNTSFVLNNLAQGDRFTIEFMQDVTGGRTVTFPSNSLFKNGQTISTQPNYVDLCNGYYDGNNILWSIDGGYISSTPSNYVAALQSLGYSPGSTEIAAYNSFDSALVAAGIKNKLKAVYLFSGSTSATHVLNYLNPINSDGAFRLTVHGTITDTYGTVTGNGSTGYFDTHFNPSTSLSFPGGAITTWFTSSSLKGAAGGYTGLSAPLPAFQVIPNFDGSNSYYAVGDLNSTSNYVTLAYPSVAIDQCVTTTRSSTSLTTVYRNGSSIGSASGTLGVSNFPNENMYLLARNANATVQDYSSNPLIFCIFSDGLTGTDVTNLYNALSTLKTGMGK